MQVFVRVVACLGVVLTVAGCVPAGSPSEDAGAGAAADTPPSLFGASPAPVERDVESPDVFSMTGTALWDGRPSLGGVWVAHSSVRDPERVIIRNTKNGKSIVGALFRREREVPGPSIQVSSDAADKLGMLAGQPADLSIIALRREEVTPAAPAATPQAASDVAAQPEASATTSSSVAGTAPPSNPKRSAGEAGVAAASAGAAAEVVPAGKGLFGFLKKKPKPDLAAPTATDVIADTPTGEIEQKPLEPLVATATAGIEQAESRNGAGSNAAAVEPVVQTDPKLRRPYVQIGTFSSEANAGFAVDQMKAEGLAASISPGNKQGVPYWRVIVGPAATVAERDAMIELLKNVGYRDAFAVKQ